MINFLTKIFIDNYGRSNFVENIRRQVIYKTYFRR